MAVEGSLEEKVSTPVDSGHASCSDEVLVRHGDIQVLSRGGTGSRELSQVSRLPSLLSQATLSPSSYSFPQKIITATSPKEATTRLCRNTKQHGVTLPLTTKCWSGLERSREESPFFNGVVHVNDMEAALQKDAEAHRKWLAMERGVMLLKACRLVHHKPLYWKHSALCLCAVPA